MKRLSILAICCIIVSACTKRIELDPVGVSSSVSVFGIISYEVENQKIEIYHTAKYFSNNDNLPVENADVTVTTSEGDVYEFEFDESGNYISKTAFAAKEGIIYSLSIDYTDNGKTKHISAETTGLEPYIVDTLYVTKQPIMGIEMAIVTMEAQNNTNVKEQFMVQLAINDSIINPQMSQWGLMSNNYTGERMVAGIATLIVASSLPVEIIEDMDNLVFDGDTLTLIVGRIEKGLYDFISQSKSEIQGESLFFSGPASNIATNIVNGVGYFGTWCTTRKECIFNDKETN